MYYMKISKTFRFTEEAAAVLDSQVNATQFLEDIILKRSGAPATIAEIKDLLESHGFLKTGNITSEPVYVTPAPQPRKSTVTFPDEPAVPPPKLKVMTNDDLKALLGTAIEDKPRHVCKENCYHWVYDINSAKYVNSLTGETRGAPEF